MEISFIILHLIILYLFISIYIFIYPSISTIYKQLCEVFTPMNSTQRDFYSGIIHNNVLHAMREVVRHAHESNIPFKVSPKASYSELEHWLIEGEQ